MSTTGSMLLSVSELMIGARRAFSALVPIAEGLGVHWREPNNYLDWDYVAGGIFEGFVLEAIRSSHDWGARQQLIKYDTRVNDYACHSYVAVESHGHHLPFVCFLTASEPFDTCLVAQLDQNRTVQNLIELPFISCRFVAIGSSMSSQDLVREILTW